MPWFNNFFEVLGMTAATVHCTFFVIFFHRCVKAVMNTMIGLDHVIESDDYMNMLATGEDANFIFSFGHLNEIHCQCIELHISVCFLPCDRATNE